MNQLMSVLLVLVVLLPASALLPIRSGLSSRSAGRLGALLCGTGFLLSLAIFCWTAAGNTPSVSLNLPPGGLEFGLTADRVTSALLMLVTGVSCLVQAFASRYLEGDLRQRRFFAGAGLLTGATSAMVAAGSLAGLALAWTLSGVAVLGLLGMYPGLPDADEGRRRALRAFIGGDLALWAAVVWTSVEWGGLGLGGAGGSAAAGMLESGGGTVVACLLVVAALSRSAQLPFKSWLPGTIAVPTPVSALLHAGVVNAGGILLIKTSFVFASSALATHIAFFAGAATAVYGTALMLSKPDVKGALAQSTTGQMGFMIMTCGLGAWVATLFHLLAHSMYKASLFLGSGSALSSESRRLRAPGPAAGGMPRAGRAIVSVLAPVPPLAGFAILLYPDPNPTSAALLAFAWATFAWITDGWLARSPGAKGLAGAASALTVASGLYVGLLSLASGFFSQNLAESGAATVSPAWLLVFVPVAALALAIRTGAVDALAGFRKTAYVALLNAGQVRRPGTGNRTPVRVPLRDSGAFRPSSQGARS